MSLGICLMHLLNLVLLTLNLIIEFSKGKILYKSLVLKLGSDIPDLIVVRLNK